MSFVVEKEAKREHIFLRGLFMGPTGSGKSRGALELASVLFDGGLPIALINTERGRGKLYSDRFKYTLIDMSGDGLPADQVDHSPQAFEQAIDKAEEMCPNGIVIVDSGSHEWMGKNGVLSQADRFGDWKKVRPLHTSFVDRLMAVQGHVIVCVRAKMKYEVSEEEVQGRKRQIITMLGVGPIQDGDFQYEFNLVARFDQQSHEAMFSGHVDPLDGGASLMVQPHVGEIAGSLTKWLMEGDPQKPPEAATPEDVATLVALLTAEGHSAEKVEQAFAIQRRENRGELSPAYVLEQTTKAQAREQERAAKKKAAEDAEKAAAKPDEQPTEVKEPEPAAAS